MSDETPDTEREALLTKLREFAEGGDPEGAHYEADRALLDYINDEQVTAAFDAIDKWYA